MKRGVTRDWGWKATPTLTSTKTTKMNVTGHSTIFIPFIFTFTEYSINITTYALISLYHFADQASYMGQEKSTVSIRKFGMRVQYYLFNASMNIINFKGGYM